MGEESRQILVVMKEYLRRQRAYGRAPQPWQANGFTLREIVAGKPDRDE